MISTGLRRWVPLLDTLGRYEPDWLRHDIVAGLVMTAMLVPAGIAYAEASGVPGINGLYATMVPLAAYAVQLVLNAAWTPIFFGLRRPGLAAIEIAILWASIVATIFFFHPVSPAAAGLLVPYLVWVSFAVALNISIWRRNPPARAAKGAR